MTSFDRIKQNWVYGGVLAGLLLLLLAPVLVAGWDRAAALAYLALPLYMLHQFEEHDDDRFRRFVNAVIGHGREALSATAVFWINFAGVWLLLGAVLWAARLASPAWAAAAGWLILLNGLLHVAQGIALRRYNPGLATAALIFVPFGLFMLATAWPLATGAVFWSSFGLAAAVHVGIVVHVRRALIHAPVGATT